MFEKDDFEKSDVEGIRPAANGARGSRDPAQCEAADAGSREMELAGLAENQLDRALSELPAVQAHVVRLRQVHGWSLRRMADHLGLDETTVAGQLRIGVQRVRDGIERARQARG